MKIPRLSRLSPGIYPSINALIEETAKVNNYRTAAHIIASAAGITSAAAGITAVGKATAVMTAAAIVTASSE